MPALKHVGRLKKSKRRAIVAYRTLPNDPFNALVIFTDSLNADEHSSLIRCVESEAGQAAYELAEAMARTYLVDGRNMLAGFHGTGKLVKIATNEIEMIPDLHTTVGLDELNQIIANQRGVSLEDLSLKGPNTPQQDPSNTSPVKETTAVVNSAPTNSVLTDEDLAASLRSQADSMFKEAKRLREQADELVPTKKKAKSTIVEES
jgi:hypothetical protein